MFPKPHIALFAGSVHQCARYVYLAHAADLFLGSSASLKKDLDSYLAALRLEILGRTWERKRKLTRTVLTYGTFDLFHIGHVNLLRRLKGLGDRLVVGLSTDDFNSLKGKTSVMPYDQRKIVLEACKYVDHVFPERHWDQKPEDIKREKVAVFAMGDDWAGKFDELEELCEVYYLPRTEDVSTTDIKRLVSTLHNEKLGELKRQLEHLSEIISKL